MKKKYSGSTTFTFVFLFMLLTSINSDAQYKINKEIYHPQDYSYDSGGPYSPGGSAIASLFLPGLGQVLAGEMGRGMIFASCEVGSLVLAYFGFRKAYLSYSDSEPIMLIGLAGAIVIPVWAMVDAARVAKVNNLASIGADMNGKSLKLSPDLKILPNMKVAPSLILTYKF